MQKEYYKMEVGEAFDKLSSAEAGLSDKEAEERLRVSGKNEIKDEGGPNPIVIFLKQFHSVMIYILFLALLISYFIGNIIDVYVIAAVIIINSCIGFFQEYKAEKSITALKKMIVPHAKVYRNGELMQIDARNLVPGDVIFLEEGDRVPADARLFFTKNFRTVEGSLTGESLPSDKEIRKLPEGTPLADQKNMVWMGTFVARGDAKAIVVSTGSQTIIGGIAKDIQKIEKRKGHFQKKVDTLAKQMGAIAIFGAVLAFFIGFFIRGFDFTEMFLFAIASLVAAIPEGLPAILAIVLAMGSQRMAKRNAIIRSLPSTETLGAISTIVTDKTGTITENTMTVKKIFLSNGQNILVSGSGWEPKGDFLENNKKVDTSKNPDLSKLLHVATVCNNSGLNKIEGKYEIVGDPTEAALVVLGEKAGFKKNNIKEKRIDDLPFNPELKYRASLSVLLEGKKHKEVYVVGAPEAVLADCNYYLKGGKKFKIDKKKREEIESKIRSMTRDSMRVLGLAFKKVPKNTEKIEKDLTSKMVFVGITGIRDPPRPEVKEAIKKAKNAGIRVIMVTGDHKETALSISKEVGLVEEDDNLVLTEEQLEKVSEKDLMKVVEKVSVFARVTPRMKLKIAEALQKNGHIIAMTGDGVNDSPALKKADVGISMGVIGTDVARESSEIVLADDNFASIINAIEEGRILFKNTRNTSSFLITTNFAENMTIISSLLAGFPLPLLPTQILWLNLVTDSAPALSLATEPGDSSVLKKEPRNPKENILSKDMMPFLIMITITMVLATLWIFKGYLPGGLDKARAGAFSVMTLTQLFNTINMRSMKKSIFRIGFLSNKNVIKAIAASFVLMLMVIYVPVLQSAFKFAALGSWELLEIIIISSSVLWLGEIYKLFKKGN